MNTNFLIQMPPCQSETFPFSRLRRVRIFLLTPCFSWVWQRAEKINRFNGLRPLLFILSLLATSAQAQQAIDPKPVDSSPDSNTRVVAETPYAVAARDGNQKIWSKVTWESNSLTGELTAKTNSFIELATASAHLVNGVWADSTDQIEITKTGAQATNSQHRLEFLGNINTSRAIDITLPEGDKHLRSTPIGLSYFDTASGKSVLIAELRNSSGQLLNSGNQVLYPSCFTDIEADLFYVNQIDKVEQLVILRQQLPAPEEWGLDSASTLLQVISEFFNPPSPVITQHIVRGAVDEQLDFGIMQMVKGEAFAIGSETNTIPVTKQWLLLDGTRQCLVESTPFTRLEPLLKDLPAPPAQAQLQDSPDGILHRVARGHPLPERKFAAKSSRPMIVASAMPKAKGVAIDWTTLTAQTNFTLKGDTTYYVSSAVNLSSTTICEGGCVVKFSPTNSSSLKLLGSVVWANSAYRPTIFSSRD